MHKITAFNNVKNIFIYIVISIIGNFLIKAFSLMILLSKTEIVLPTYQLYNVTYLIKIT